MQLTFFYFLPNILLSGFMFPFRGMPEWAQWIGSVLAAHLLQSARARHPAQGQRLARLVAEPVAARRVRAGRDGDRRALLSQDARLKARARRSSSLAMLCSRLHGRSGLSRARSARGRSLRFRSADRTVRLVPERDIPAEWWSVFGSPEIDALVQRALARSPTLDQARARLVAGAASFARRARAPPSIRRSTSTAGAERQRIDPATFGFPRRAQPRAVQRVQPRRRRLVQLRHLRRHAARAGSAGGGGRLPGATSSRRRG